MNDFNDKAKNWDENPMHLERTKAVAGEMLKRLPLSKSMHALEFGAGTGLLSFFLKDLLGSITLMDTSQEMLNMAAQKLNDGDQDRIRTVFFDLGKAAYTNEKFDLIFTQMVLHHISDVKGILEKFSALLNRGGYLAIADLYTEDGSFHEPGVEVHHGFDPAKLSVDLQSSGFEDIRSGQCFIIRKELAPETFREYPVFLLTAGK
jgi:ubiquinone/menaquinone biosynthesis C-methylase UbiE